MIPPSNVFEHISDFDTKTTEYGAERKVVSHFEFGVIFLHPEDPRFGCDANRELYSFRRPRGHGKTGTRKPGVDYARPRILKGTKHKTTGFFWVTIDNYTKVKKEEFIDEILKPTSKKNGTTSLF